MKNVLPILLVLAAALSASAGDAAERPAFPDDYIPHPCAGEHCASVPRFQVPELALRYRGVTVPNAWLDAHWDELTALLQPGCAKATTCIATGDNKVTFCNDLAQREWLKICSRWDRESDDWRICDAFVRVWGGGYASKLFDLKKQALECAAAAPAAAPRALEVWMVPDHLPAHYRGTFTVYALDAETRVPVMAGITAGGRRVSRKDSPGSAAVAYDELEWPLKLRRVPNDAGHEDLVAPSLTVAARGYDTVMLTIPWETPKLIVEMTPPASKLRPGANRVTVAVKDAETGEPVEMRVMAGERVAGTSNEPFELRIRPDGTRPELWITSLFDRYSDVVVAPAK